CISGRAKKYLAAVDSVSPDNLSPAFKLPTTPRKLPLIPDTPEVELSGIFPARRFHEEVEVQRDPDRLDLDQCQPSLYERRSTELAHLRGAVVHRGRPASRAGRFG